MAEEIKIIGYPSKEECYRQLVPQIDALIASENDAIANLSNIMAALKQSMNFFWVGCYFVKGNELVLGPFQGFVACTRIAFGRGVCGSSWKEKKTIIVKDVSTHPNHISCNSASKSEIVVPGFDLFENVILVLDIDSDKLNDFDETDSIWLNKIMRIIEKKLVQDAI